MIRMSDPRDSWFLNIEGVQKSDAGKYICQLNTARPISISGTLSVVGEKSLLLEFQNKLYLPLHLRSETVKL